MRTILMVACAAVASGWAASVARAEMPTGCKVIPKVHTQKSLTHTRTMFRMVLRVSVCYKAGKMTLAGETCYIDSQDPAFVWHSGCSTDHYYYGWLGNAKGGYYAQATATFKQCIPFFGCDFSQGNLTLMVWVTANGAFVDGKRVW